MKTKNTKVRLKDIKQGVTLYTGHPRFGVDKRVVTSRPYMVKSIGLFFNCKCSILGTDHHSTSDMGITNPDSYYRAFKKRKHAEEWVNKMKTDPAYIRHMNHQDEMQELFEEMESYYYD